MENILNLSLMGTFSMILLISISKILKFSSNDKYKLSKFILIFFLVPFYIPIKEVFSVKNNKFNIVINNIEMSKLHTYGLEFSTNNLFKYGWIIIVLTSLCIYIIKTVRLQKSLKQSSLEKNGVFYQNVIKTSFVMGIIKPKIYIWNDSLSRDIDYIISHEKIHIKRNDNLFVFIAYMVRAIHFFNPFVWIFYSYLTKHMELSCDEIITRDMDRDEKKIYCNSIIKSYSQQNNNFAYFSNINLKDRIENIASKKIELTKNKFLSVIVILVSFVFILSTVTISMAKSDFNQTISLKKQTINLDENTIHIEFIESDGLTSFSYDLRTKRISIVKDENNFSNDYLLEYAQEISSKLEEVIHDN